MAKRIKLENVIPILKGHKHGDEDYSRFPHCPKCGQNTIAYDIKEEYVCEACRHLVEPTYVFCPHCGGELSAGDKVEHHIGGLQIDNELFSVVKDKIKGEKKP